MRLYVIQQDSFDTLEVPTTARYSTRLLLHNRALQNLEAISSSITSDLMAHNPEYLQVLFAHSEFLQAQLDFWGQVRDDDIPVKFVPDIALRHAWNARVSLSDDLLIGLPRDARVVLRFVLAWCTRLNPRRRPSMEIVHLLLVQVLTGHPSSSWQTLPESVVSNNLTEPYWTMGDGEFFAAICRCRGEPLHVQRSLSLSDGGLQLLGRMWQEHQVCSAEISACVCVCVCLCVLTHTGMRLCGRLVIDTRWRFQRNVIWHIRRASMVSLLCPMACVQTI